MSSIVIKGNTSGQVEIAAPDVAGSTTLTLPTGTGTVITDTAPKTGNVLQVVSVTDKAQSSYNMLSINNGYTNYGLNENGFDLTTLDISITPSSSSSKILLMTNIFFWAAPAAYGVFRLKRGIGGVTPAYSSSDAWMSGTNSVAGNLSQMGSTGISTNGDTSWYGRTLNFNWLDSPNTTSAVVYRFNFRMEEDNGNPFWLNRAGYNTNDYGANTGVSSIIAMEVAG